MMKMCLALLCVATCMILSCVVPQIVADTIRPDDEQATEPDLPAWPFVQGCGGTFKFTFPVSGHTGYDTAYAWMAISRNDSTLVVSDPSLLLNGNFTGRKINLYFEQDLNNGIYDLNLYISGNISDVGNISNRLTASGPYKFNLDYSLIEPDRCLDRIPLGDSVYFVADSVPIFLAPFYEWQVYWDSNSVGSVGRFEISCSISSLSDKFVKLGDNLFFPLKLSRSNRIGEDSVAWILTFIRERGGNDDTVQADLLVRPPNFLGNSNAGFDDLIVLWSDHFAVPPQIVKSIIDAESDFLIQSFRYEIKFDHNLFQPAMHGNLHYERYLLADSARTGTPLGFDKNGNSVVQGDSIAGLDYDPYFVLSNWSLNPPVAIVDDNQDSIIAAYELRNHDLRFNYSGSDFTAQIVMSSSYGLMHPLAVTLIDEVGYQSRSPQDMFDPEKAILWGTFILSDFYYDPDVVNTSYSWNERWRTAIGKYNGGKGASESYGNFSNLGIAAYVEEVWLHINQYQPVLSP